jgi:glycine cleavage system H protein
MVAKESLFYTKEHEWVELVNPDYARIGITEYAVEQLGDVVFVELPEVNDEVEAEEEFATVESVKSSSEIYAPLSGTVANVNEALEDEPELMNDSPLEEGWIVEVQSSGEIDTSELLSLKEYEEYIDTL